MTILELRNSTSFKEAIVLEEKLQEQPALAVHEVESSWCIKYFL
jgi:hypothetical protein